MAPTICSGKKRQTRTIATTDIRRHGQRSQLNQGLSNIVNYVAKGSINPRVSTSMRIQTTHNQQEKNTTGTIRAHHSANNEASSIYKNHNHLTQTSATLAVNHCRQQFSFVSDNAVATSSSIHSDSKNEFNLRLANETSTNDTFSSASSNTNTTSSSMPSLASSLSSSSSQKETSSYHQHDDRRFQRFTSKVNGYDDVSTADSASNAPANNIHSKHFYHYDNDNDEEDDGSGADDSLYAGVSDTDMDTDSMTSLDTEKSAELKRGNHPLWRDKFLVKQQENNRKSLSNVSNTEGLLSIAIKTIKLVKSNQLLQQRLTQLQMETSEFIQSVLANPENRHFRDNIKEKVKEVENI